MYPTTRLRRLRHNSILREMIAKTNLSSNDFVLPLFICEDLDEKRPIKSMPGHFQLSINDLDNEIKDIQAHGIKSVILFGLPAKKDDLAINSYDPNNIIMQAIKKIKDLAPDLLVITDVCCCEYTVHGHCGIMNTQNGKLDLDNDATLPILANQAIAHAQAGADIVAPSGMIDGMIQTIRQGLDQEQFSHIPILSYAVKYSSSLYGPFREAVDCAPSYGDRQTYQMDFRSNEQAIREAEIDLQEGADILMVKPASFYLDILQQLKDKFPGVPLSAYQVSGEYAMMMSAFENGLLNKEKTIIESLTSIKRAGADIIINYFAKDAVKLLQNS